MARSRSFIATPPGATIKEQLVDRGMSQKEFASRMDMSEKHISRLINGEVSLTPDMAYRLEMVLGVPAHFWNNLESIYREKLAKVEAENALDADKELARKFPYNEMSKNGWVAETRSASEKAINLRKFFEVVQLKMLANSKLLPSIACRRLSITERADFALIAWAQRAKIEARSINTAPINISKLSECLDSIRAMTTQEPSVFCPKLINSLSECGIALVFLPHIGGSFLHGATFYEKGKIVIGLTVRGKDADKFWFSLFHEIGHIILGHLNQEEGTTADNERDADEFAREKLIPKTVFDQFTKAGKFNREALVSFAASNGIDPGIVVGRLQKEGYIEFSWYNDLKTRYTLSA